MLSRHSRGTAAGRVFSAGEIAQIRATVAWLPKLPRTEVAATVCEPAIPNLPLPLARVASGRWLRGLQGIDHGVEQVLPGIEGEVEGERPQVFEEGAPR